MTYLEWFNAHAQRHKSIVEKLLACGNTKEEIIEYFVFENMVKNEPDFCLLYTENKKCHDLEYLNCYLCACPYFRFSDKGVKKVDGKTKFSFCSIDAKEGKAAVYGDAIHQDCSACTIPHAKNYVGKNFDFEWEKIMNKCSLTTIGTHENI